MSELTSAQRSRLRKGTFAVPQGEKYPVPDRAHARAALQMSHGARSGHAASEAEHAAVHRKVREKYPEMYREHMMNAHGRDTASEKIRRGLRGG